MSILLDRLTVRAHYGSAKVKEIKQASYQVLNHLIAAKRIAEAAGLLGYSIQKNLRCIRTIEKHLRFLEQKKALKIDDTGTVHYTCNPVSCDHLGTGVLDMEATARNIILDAREQPEEFCPMTNWSEFSQNHFPLLFKKAADPEVAGRYIFRFHELLRRNLKHPILRFVTSKEVAASYVLFDENVKAAKAARRDWTNGHPEASPRIAVVEAAMRKAKSLRMNEIRQRFDPRRQKPYSAVIYPSAEISMVPRQGVGAKRRYKFALVVSDLHVGNRVFTDEDEFLRFSLMGEELKSTLACNGDTFDMAEAFFSFYRTMETNQRFWNALCRRERTIIIPGNHDEELKKFAKKSGKLFAPNVYLPPAIDYLFEKGIYIEHMHQADRMFESRFWRVLNWPISFFEKLLGTSFVKWLELFQRDIINTLSGLKNIVRMTKSYLNWIYPFFKVDEFREENLWGEKKVKAITNRVKEVWKRHGIKIYIGGHEHFAGVAATFKKVVDNIRDDPQIGGGKLKFYSSGGWKGREGYAGDFLVIDFTDEGSPMVYPFVWEHTHEPVVVFRKDGLRARKSLQ